MFINKIYLFIPYILFFIFIEVSLRIRVPARTVSMPLNPGLEPGTPLHPALTVQNSQCTQLQGSARAGEIKYI